MPNGDDGMRNALTHVIITWKKKNASRIILVVLAAAECVDVLLPLLLRLL